MIQILQLFNKFTQISWMALELGIIFEYEFGSMDSIISHRLVDNQIEEIKISNPPRRVIYVKTFDERPETKYMLPKIEEIEPRQTVLLVMYPEFPSIDFILAIYNVDKQLVKVVYIQASLSVYQIHKSNYLTFIERYVIETNEENENQKKKKKKTITRSMRDIAREFVGITEKNNKSSVPEIYIHFTTATNPVANKLTIKKYDPDGKVYICNPNTGLIRTLKKYYISTLNATIEQEENNKNKVLNITNNQEKPTTLSDEIMDVQNN